MFCMLASERRHRPYPTEACRCGPGTGILGYALTPVFNRERV